MATALIGLGFMAAWSAFGPPITIEAADRLIGNCLPAGSHKAAVKRFLDSRHWHHSGCVVPDADRRNDIGQPEYGASAVIYGWSDEWVDWQGFLNDWSTYLQMTFIFDSRGKLIRYDVRLLDVA